MISFVKVLLGDPARINIYITKMTVSTCINHPKKGRTQLFRKKYQTLYSIKYLKIPVCILIRDIDVNNKELSIPSPPLNSRSIWI